MMRGRGLVLVGMVVGACAQAGVLGFGSAPALARTSHTYESQITEVPASSGAAVPGPLRQVNSMTVFEGDLYVAEGLDGQVPGFSFRADEFGESVPGSGGYGFVSQLPKLASPNEILQQGIAFGTATGETEMYLGKENSSTVAVFGVGLCALECANLQERWTGSDTPEGKFGEVDDVAVDDSQSAGDWASGDVIVDAGESIRESGEPEKSRVLDVFRPEAGGKEKYVTQLTGPSPGQLFPEGTGRLAVSGFNGDLVVLIKAHYSAEESVDVFKPVAGEKYELSQILSLPSGSFEGLDNVAVDAGNGEIYVATISMVYEFNKFGVFVGDLTGESTPEKEWSSASEIPSIAVDPVSHRVFVGVFDSTLKSAVVDVFSPDVVIPDVESEAVSNVRIEAGTHTWGVRLNGTVDADEAGPARCWFVWGTSRSFGQESACTGEIKGEAGEKAVAVRANLSGLEPGTTYYYRLQAENATGKNLGEESQDQSFTTPGPGLHGEWATEVSSSSVRLHATIAPEGKPTSYHFEYDASPYVQGEAPHGTSVPLTGASAGSSGEAAVEQHVEGLTASTAYHYRVVALSEVEVSSGVFAQEEFDGPDQVFTTQRAGGALVLPDGRAWEQVSSVDKHGAVIRPIGEASLVQSSADGSKLTYMTDIPPEAQPQGFGDEAQSLAVRGGGAWSSVDVGLSHVESVGPSIGFGNEYRFFSEDLGLSVVEPLGPFSPLEGVYGGKRVAEAFPPASERTPYLRHDLTCEAQRTSCYEPLLTGCPKAGEPCASPIEENADVPAGTEFGGEANAILGNANFVGATPDLSDVVVNAFTALTSAPAPGGGLYEWAADKRASERLEAVSVLPSSEGGGIVFAGFGNSEGTFRPARHMISDDGSRVFFTAEGPQGIHLYMRDVERGETVRLDVPEGSLKAGSGEALFQDASTGGSVAFFTAKEKLTGDSNATASLADLYECEIKLVGGELACALKDLTSGSDGESSGVQRAISSSESGGYVYFVADGVLASGASPGDCSESGFPPANATCNLYVWHDGTTKFIAAVSANDAPDWGGNLNKMTSRVSPDGSWFAFMSNRSLTGYDNRDAVSGIPDEEVYLYDATSGRLVCASCDPTGARPFGVEYAHLMEGDGEALVGGDRVWPETRWIAANVPGWTMYRLGKSLHQSRYLSDSGRLFFNSSDALVPQDTNGNEDVYEYEPVSVGDCSGSSATFSGNVGGCIGLISSGSAFGESGFLDASETGNDVFFLTTGRLVSSDVDTSLDVYDAHVCSTAAPCATTPPAQPPECGSASSCRAAPPAQPSIYGAPASATFSGTGNIAPVAPPSPGGKPVTKGRALTRAQKLTRALVVCHKQKRRGKRAGCEKSARRRYGAAKAKGR